MSNGAQLPARKGPITRKLAASKKYRSLKGAGAKNQYMFGGITNAKKRMQAKRRRASHPVRKARRRR